MISDSPRLRPTTLADTGRRSSSTNRLSHGRGGAGNINSSLTNKPIDAADFETPTLKGEVYTTGRGGSGNMAKNLDPAEARRAQDVIGLVAPLHLARALRCVERRACASLEAALSAGAFWKLV